MSLSEKQIIELESLLENLESTTDRCLKGLLKQSEAAQRHSDLWKQALRIPAADSDEWRILDRKQRSTTAYWEESLSGYVAKDCGNFAGLRAILKQLLENNEPEFLRIQKRSKSQKFFAAGEEYEAKKAIFEAMTEAASSLYVVDSYLDHTIFDYLESLDSGIQLKLLTGKTKPIFKTLLVPFSRKRGLIEAKICTDCHDRFLLLDEEKAVHLGASINFAGKKAFMLNSVTDDYEFNKFSNEFHSWWSKGKSIV